MRANEKTEMDTPDFKQVRCATAAFQQNISAHPAALDLLSLMGWHATVDNLEKFWVYDHPVGSPQLK